MGRILKHHADTIELAEHTADCRCERSPGCRGMVGPLLVWYYQDTDQPGVFFGRRNSPPDDDEMDAMQAAYEAALAEKADELAALGEMGAMQFADKVDVGGDDNVADPDLA